MDNAGLATRPADPRSLAPASQRTLAAVLGGVTLAALASTLLRVPVPDTGPGLRAGELLCGVNPNTAPWWELTALPGVGDVTARSVVAYREARPTGSPSGQPVFRRPADLDAVPGIGPRTIARITPYLMLTDEKTIP